MLFPLVISGVLATALMSVFLVLVHRKQSSNGDMHRALGSLFTESERNSLPVGLFIHALSGIAFAFVYYALIRIAPLQAGSPLVIFFCLGVSFFHGLVVSMLLVISVAEHHPLRKFRQAGMHVVFIYLMSHLVYGFSLGLAFYWMLTP